MSIRLQWVLFFGYLAVQFTILNTVLTAWLTQAQA
jgi:hypothetical protein